MFNQVKVSKNDREALRFLWWEKGDPTAPTKTYQMTTHIFGGVWSPSATNYALRKCAADNEEVSTEAAKTIISNFYVDDCLKSLATVEEVWYGKKANIYCATTSVMSNHTVTLSGDAELSE